MKFHSARGLKLHLRKHINGKDLNCNVCGEKFATPELLMEHRHTHTGEMPFMCNKCGAGFQYRLSLTHHIKKRVCQVPYQPAVPGGQMSQIDSGSVEPVIQEPPMSQLKLLQTNDVQNASNDVFINSHNSQVILAQQSYTEAHQEITTVSNGLQYNNLQDAYNPASDYNLDINNAQQSVSVSSHYILEQPSEKSSLQPEYIQQLSQQPQSDGNVLYNCAPGVGAVVSVAPMQSTSTQLMSHDTVLVATSVPTEPILAAVPTEEHLMETSAPAATLLETSLPENVTAVADDTTSVNNVDAVDSTLPVSSKISNSKSWDTGL